MTRPTLPRFGDPGFLTRVELLRDRVPEPRIYPFNIPALQQFHVLPLHAKVTYIVGENGSGKSTLLEAIAVAVGFNAEGGTPNFSFATRSSESSLHGALRLVKSARKPATSYFLRAESFFNVATEIERIDRETVGLPPLIHSYGGKSLHEQSHGESFMALLNHRFGANGFYILDEPEAALSPKRQIALLERIHDLVKKGSQFIIATHAPIVLSYPNAWIYQLSLDGSAPARTAYSDTHTVQVTQEFLSDREPRMRELVSS